MGDVIRLFAANGGHPQMGKELARAFLEAGFADIRATASFESCGTVEDRAFLRDLITGWFFSPETIGAAAKLDLAGSGRFEGWRRSLDRWMDEPGAFAAFAWGEAMGRKSQRNGRGGSETDPTTHWMWSAGIPGVRGAGSGRAGRPQKTAIHWACNGRESGDE